MNTQIANKENQSMALDHDALMGTRMVDKPTIYTDRDTMLYALGVGFGNDPLNERELSYVFENRSLKSVPTMASILTPGDLLAECGWDYSLMVLGEQKLDLFRPLPPEGRLLTDSRVVSVFDKGPDIGALITIQSEVRMAKDDTALFTVGSTVIARGDGGFGGPEGNTPNPHQLPKREPDMSCDIETQPDQALLFRLCRDRNPLHADPGRARQAGFERPILHGLCSYGIACRAILKTICEYDYTLITGFNTRFTAPVYPGDTITTEMWQDSNIVSFRCLVKERDSIVIDNGECALAA